MRLNLPRCSGTRKRVPMSSVEVRLCKDDVFLLSPPFFEDDMLLQIYSCVSDEQVFGFWYDSTFWWTSFSLAGRKRTSRCRITHEKNLFVNRPVFYLRDKHAPSHVFGWVLFVWYSRYYEEPMKMTHPYHRPVRKFLTVAPKGVDGILCRETRCTTNRGFNCATIFVLPFCFCVAYSYRLFLFSL